MPCERFLLRLIFPSLALLILIGCGDPLAVPTKEPVPPSGLPPTVDKVSEMVQKITWLRSTQEYGHTAIMIQTDERTIYLDPVDLVDKELPKADLILITHDHVDHFSPQTILALSKESTTVVSNERTLPAIGGSNTIPLLPGQKVNVDGLDIEGVSAYNGYHPKELNNIGFVITIDDFRVYCSGDTSLNPEMEALSHIDIALLNVRNPYSLTGEEAVRFAASVKPKILIPIHWMPDNDTYHDQMEIDYLRQNIPPMTLCTLLDLK